MLGVLRRCASSSVSSRAHSVGYAWHRRARYALGGTRSGSADGGAGGGGGGDDVDSFWHGLSDDELREALRAAGSGSASGSASGSESAGNLDGADRAELLALAQSTMARQMQRSADAARKIAESGADRHCRDLFRLGHVSGAACVREVSRVAEPRMSMCGSGARVA